DGNTPGGLPLRRTADILRELGSNKRDGQVLVGFAMETQNAEANAARKLSDKNLDLIVLNNLRDSGAGFGTGTNLVTLLFRDGRREQLPLADKKIVAAAIVDQLAGLAPA
ncbi:MAG: phosphopantothenoylcysteine decarboxylase, partial [Bacteroidetes bacterium]|nr:phosphopantothenoylcysteine decarboxylase [Bacteroidota bacterium]